MKNNFFKSVIMILIGGLSVLMFQACQQEKTSPNEKTHEVPNLGDGALMAVGDSITADYDHYMSFADAATAIAAWKIIHPNESNRGFAMSNASIDLLQTYQGCVALGFMPGIVNQKETQIIIAIDAIGNMVIPSNLNKATAQHAHKECPPFCGTDTGWAAGGSFIPRDAADN